MQDERNESIPIRDLVLRAVLPLTVGATVYYLFFPDTYFVRGLDRFFGVSLHIPYPMENVVCRILRCYLADFLWAYALMGTVRVLIGKEKHLFLTVLLAEIVLESLQLHPSVPGTFDICDIFVELAANILVIHFPGGKNYEKKQSD